MKKIIVIVFILFTISSCSKEPAYSGKYTALFTLLYDQNQMLDRTYSSLKQATTTADALNIIKKYKFNGELLQNKIIPELQKYPEFTESGLFPDDLKAIVNKNRNLADAIISLFSSESGYPILKDKALQELLSSFTR